MIFDALALEDAEGAILAHTLRLNGRTLKKGQRLTSEDLALIAASGHRSVTAAWLEPGDLDEDTAARKVAAGVAGAGLSLSEARTGRCNLIAAEAGLLQVDADRIDRINVADEAVTVATLPPYACVTPDEVVATIKIIPFAVASAAVARALSGEGEMRPMSVQPFRPLSVGLVLTRVPGGRERLLDKAAETLAGRLGALGSSLAAEVRCGHEAAAVAEAIEQLRGQECDVVILCGAAATVDRRDVVPAGIELAGGVVEHFGMPVEPGNLLVLGRLGDIPVIGMPGCARSIKTNGFDWVLRRVVAGIAVSRRDIMGMGVGGLLSEKESRTLRLGSAVGDGAERRFVTDRPSIAAVVLAAGQSKRMGARNKLVAEIDGKPMIAHAVDAALASHAEPVIVVTGHDHEAIEKALAGRNVTIVHAAEFGRGMSASLKQGLAALPDDVDGAVICLGDMPRVGARHIDRLIAAFDPAADAAICVTYNRGKRGNPVLWGRQFFDEMRALEGDVGARALLRRYADLVQPVEMDEPGMLVDVDQPEDLAAVTGPEKTNG